MLRWLVRLVVFGLIGLGIAYAISRLMGQDEDLDEYDDLEAGFEFSEAPVEIDVPADGGAEVGASGGAGGGSGAASSSGGGGNGSTDVTGRIGRAGSSGGSDTGSSTETASATGEGSSLTDINGVGPNYAARLEAAGINTLEELASADAEALIEQMEVIGGAATIETWIMQAKEFTSGSSQASSNGRSQQ